MRKRGERRDADVSRSRAEECISVETFCAGADARQCEPAGGRNGKRNNQPSSRFGRCIPFPDVPELRHLYDVVMVTGITFQYVEWG
ncbi:hypothetical protein GCM10009624_31750 [Gordonia sinesedis]